LPPEELLKLLLDIEREAGRLRDPAKGYRSRTLDLDLLYYGNEAIQTTFLTVPHPSLHKRRFILKPLADIAPQFYHPVLGKDHRNLLQECRDTTPVEKLPLQLYPKPQDFFSSLGFIAIEGNIGAGKTTLARRISEDLNAKLILERFADNPFLPKFYEDQARYAFPLELSFLADRYQQFIEDTRQLDLFRNFVVSDYDIYKSLIFAKITLGEEEFRLYRKFFSFMYREVRKPNLYVYLYQQTERLLEQISRRGRAYEKGIPKEYLEKIQKGYFEFMKNTQELNSVIIDVGDLDFVARKGDYLKVLDQMVAHVLSPFG
jgi:deoxyadenosine/deoxycytidine kinase